MSYYVAQALVPCKYNMCNPVYKALPKSMNPEWLTRPDSCQADMNQTEANIGMEGGLPFAALLDNRRSTVYAGAMRRSIHISGLLGSGRADDTELLSALRQYSSNNPRESVQAQSHSSNHSPARHIPFRTAARHVTRVLWMGRTLIRRTIRWSAEGPSGVEMTDHLNLAAHG